MHGRLPPARGRLNGSGPIAVIDIGSNSVRLVVYERKSRTPTVLFNEKVLAGLGRGVAATGILADESVACALAALHRFRSLCEHMGVDDTHVIATAAARDASNGSEFIARVSDILGVDVRILNGAEEAYYSGLGIISGFWCPHGIVGDMGGGSLELAVVDDTTLQEGMTFPLGGLRLQETSEGKLSRAEKLVDASLANYKWPELEKGERTFYAVGGTWRSMARMHMAMHGYPVNVMHSYQIAADDAIAFCRQLCERSVDNLEFANVVSKQRRPLLPYGAIVLERILKGMKAEKLVLSAIGVREGLLHEQLPEAIRAQDPLIESAREMAILRARSPDHAEELVEWTDSVFSVLGIDETQTERRLRHAACLLSDVSWRAHPDYRAEQSFNFISNATFIGIDHPGRAYLAAAVFYRHEGLGESGLPRSIRSIATDRLRERARLLGGVLRLASVLSASIAGILPQSRLEPGGESITLRLAASISDLQGERVLKRLNQFAKLLDAKGEIVVDPT